MTAAGLSDAMHRRVLLLVAALNLAVLVLTAGHQIYDTNFYSLWEATALRAGDHPYRDFFEWGIPLQAVVSLGAQLVAGNRLIGEFGAQWLGIVIGGVVSFHLGLRASGSVAASLALLVLTLAILSTTATYHYPKLLLYPLAIWVMWRYMEKPGLGRAAVVGLVTAAAFLFRHDHGVYVAAAAVLAFGLTRLMIPASRDLRLAALESGVAGTTALLLLVPWLFLVHANEGLPEYVEARLQRYATGSPYSNPYASLLSFNPIRALRPEQAPPPTPGVLKFEWLSHVDETERQRLQAEYALRPAGRDAEGRWQYEVRNRFDPRLLGLQDLVNNSVGVEWDRLSDLRWPLPARADAVMWLQQVVLLVPVLLVVAAGLEARQSRRLGEPVSLQAFQLVVAGAFLALIDWRQFREPGYMAGVVPVTAALGTRLLATRSRTRWRPVWTVVAAGMLFVTTVATFVFARDGGIFTPWRLARDVPAVFAELVASPPIDGFAPREDVLALDRATWSESDADAVRTMMRYMHDCTAPGDRVLVTGQTPFQVGYYVGRPIAGGHLFWHERWRSDPVRERQSLLLLQQQSVPFAHSTHDPVLEDLKPYPAIREYVLKHYVELEGSGGLLLVDTRRQPTGSFEPLGFPCFRERGVAQSHE